MNNQAISLNNFAVLSTDELTSVAGGLAVIPGAPIPKPTPDPTSSSSFDFSLGYKDKDVEIGVQASGQSSTSDAAMCGKQVGAAGGSPSDILKCYGH